MSAPLAQTDKITMVSTGDGPVGASKLTEEVPAKKHLYKILNFKLKNSIFSSSIGINHTCKRHKKIDTDI